MKVNKLHTPDGVRDFLPQEYFFKRGIEDELLKVFMKYGFSPVSSPTLEYIEVFEDSVNSSQMHKFLDRDGSILALRADMTSAIARIASTMFDKEDIPLKLCYIENSFRYNESYQGKLREVTQAGVELIGVNSKDTDGEIISVAVNSLLASGLTDFKVHIGQVQFLEGVLEESGLDEATCQNLREFIENKDYVEVGKTICGRKIPEGIKALLSELPLLIGGLELLDRAESLVGNKKSKAAIKELREIHKTLNGFGEHISKYISFDLGMSGFLDYYTGIIFRAYARGIGQSVIDGGRYDKLLSKFGCNHPAVGFAIIVNELIDALENQKQNTDERYLTFALAKGRLADETMERLNKIGITCEEMLGKSRKLIFVNEELKLRFFLAKATDVPTYVEYGAADIGVVGKDTILEERRKVYEIYDLGFGKCRVAVAGKADSSEKLKRSNNIRVATKYPNIALDYFNKKKQQTVEIIKLSGSVELGPIVGLTDVIVDIVETGSTLRENGLVVLEEICPVSARIIVNHVSMKLEHRRISDVIKKLEEVQLVLDNQQ